MGDSQLRAGAMSFSFQVKAKKTPFQVADEAIPCAALPLPRPYRDQAPWRTPVTAESLPGCLQPAHRDRRSLTRRERRSVPGLGAGGGAGPGGRSGGTGSGPRRCQGPAFM